MAQRLIALYDGVWYIHTQLSSTRIFKAHLVLIRLYRSFVSTTIYFLMLLLFARTASGFPETWSGIKFLDTWGDIAFLFGVYAVFLILSYRRSGIVQSQAWHGTARTESDDLGGTAFGAHAAPAFNIVGAAMMGDIDTNGHVYGQTD